MPTNFPTTVPTMSRKRANEEPPASRVSPPYGSPEQDDDDDVALFGMVSSVALVQQGLAQFQALTASREIADSSEPRQKRWLQVQATAVMR